MARQELDNLVRIGKLKAEPPSREEYDGMLAAARTSLADAQKDLDPDSKFTLAYGAAHRLALAALRREGYRSEDRISVFQTLVHTVGTSAADVQVLLRAHNERNLAEYQGRGHRREAARRSHPLHEDSRSRRWQALGAFR